MLSVTKLIPETSAFQFKGRQMVSAKGALEQNISNIIKRCQNLICIFLDTFYDPTDFNTPSTSTPSSAFQQGDCTTAQQREGISNPNRGTHNNSNTMNDIIYSLSISLSLCIYIYIYVYMCAYIYIYAYIYICNHYPASSQSFVHLSFRAAPRRDEEAQMKQPITNATKHNTQ